MIKKDIVNNISDKLGINADDVRVIVDSFMSEFEENISKGENIYLRGLGSFTFKETKPKKRFNISKGENEITPSKKVLSFKPSLEILKKIKEL